MHLPRWFRILALVAHAVAMVALGLTLPNNAVGYPLLILTISGTYLTGRAGGVGLTLVATLLLIDESRSPAATVINSVIRFLILLAAVYITYLLTWHRRALQERTHQLEQEIAVRNEYTAVVAHELRNPLLGIRAATEVLHSHPEPEKIIAGIRDEATAALSLIDGMTELAAIETGRLRCVMRPVDLAEVIHLATEIREGDERIRIRGLDQSLPVMGDRERLAQVVKNLLGNAVKYSPPGEPIEVEAGVVADRNAAIVSVRDHGAGIPVAERPQLFRKFKRLSTAGGTRGSGLGLYICQQIVSDHGGTLEASWPSGGGTRFAFTLPLLRRGSPAGGTPAS